METQTKFYTLEQAAQQAGVTYNRLWFALVTKKLAEPARVGRARLFTTEDIEKIKAFFEGRK